MNIDQLSKEYEISPVVREIVALTKETTGKDISFQLLINLNTDGVTKIARARMPKHIIKIKENSTDRVNHIIVHECGHILRLMKAEPQARVIPSSNNETADNAYRALKDELAAIPEAARNELFDLWTGGIITQLINLPVDVRIETWIYKAYPAFREMQLKSLAIDVQNALLGLSDKIRKSTVEAVFNKSNAMVYAYLKSITPVTGEAYIDEFDLFPRIRKTGEKLFAYLEDEDKGYAQDIEIIDAWAEILEVKDWFIWIGFEDVPETYYE